MYSQSDVVIAFIVAIIGRWYWFSLNVPFGLEKMLQLYDKDLYERKIGSKISVGLRRSIFLSCAFAGLMFASFGAFQEQYAKGYSKEDLCPSYQPLSDDQRELLEEAFRDTQIKIDMGAYGDRSAHLLAQHIAAAISQNSKNDATVYAGGELDREDEHGIEVGIRNHLHPSIEDQKLLQRFRSSRLPFTIIEMNKDEAKTNASMYIFVAPQGEKCRM